MHTKKNRNDFRSPAENSISKIYIQMKAKRVFSQHFHHLFTNLKVKTSTQG